MRHEYSQIGITPPDATKIADFGKVEYRVNPHYWVEAVARMTAS